MGIQSYPAASSGGAGLIAQRPKFTLKATYDLSFYNSGYQGYYMDAAYDAPTGSIVWATAIDQGTNGLRWQLGSSSATNIVFPATPSSRHQIISGFDGALYMVTNSSGAASYYVYRSTNGGTSWQSTFTAGYINSLIPLSNKTTAYYNSTDVVPMALVSSHTNLHAYNASAGTIYSGSNGTYTFGGRWEDSSGDNWAGTYAPIRKGDDDFAISGYLARRGQTPSGAYYGSHGFLSNPSFNNFRAGPSAEIYNDGMYSSSTGYGSIDHLRQNIPGRWSSIENRWMILSTTTSSPLLFDLQSNKFVGGAPGLMWPMPTGNCTRPIYISATKKLYVAAAHSSANIKMYEYDVTFE